MELSQNKAGKQSITATSNLNLLRTFGHSHRKIGENLIFIKLTFKKNLISFDLINLIFKKVF